MRHLFVIVLAASLLPAVAFAAPVEGKTEPVKAKNEPVKGKRPVARKTKGYGFLPGYEPPPQRPLFGEDYAPEARYWYRGDFHYGYGGPGFYRGRWNGGGFGPCWTQTPAGPIWNCGK